ncbi:hypothetical protein MPTK1_2g07820 [Marchantia polymorpha subsp. ruderalis]|uniref:F420-0:Gamma-glutamyl ligase n=1 Tax=Marchantia polymorpha TaxID=3197 RepID=A0A2R6XGL6_MARPO|nr:hypothetical protein MARPO_0015s0068 [Marchantia polymorpha]BBN01493.1 hypothetical protein Mp_2g07820 [Marchantia polymorpha subsp. ruderalis]|eukprot:PTQ45260.1 hypothetical protein MARPO_0015s0068 [Marchantia polymorpha]
MLCLQSALLPLFPPISNRVRTRPRWISRASTRCRSYSDVHDAVPSTYGAENAQWLSTELQRLRTNQKSEGDGLLLTRGQWCWVLQDHDHYQFKGEMKFHNTTKRFELFIPEVSAKLQLLANVSLDSVTSSVKILPRHKGGNPPPRPDGNWTAYITRAGESTTIEVLVDIVSNNGDSLTGLQTGVVEVEYISYGPHGRTRHMQHAVLPLHYPEVSSNKLIWRKAEGGAFVLPIHTHILSHLDDPLQVLRKYVLPHAKAGDVIAIGETPLAIMQGRFRHPQGVRPGVLARLACRLFHPTSSLATACGLQVLIDIAGRLRVVVAVVLAVIARVLGSRGMFYRVAGDQARLIDDVTGTLPPYDQFITLGPVRVQATVDALSRKTGFEVAVVDVNDLKRVQVLGASQGVSHRWLEAALRHNPAGNADEQTPIVLIRKSA